MSLRPRPSAGAIQPHSQGPSFRWTLGDLPFVGMTADQTTPPRKSINVKLMGGKTVDAPKPGGWGAVMADKAGAFEEFYSRLTSKLPDHDFAFFTDGDPPDKEDDWKVFTAYVAAKPGNSLTIVRKDDSKRDERIKLWQDKLDVSRANAANAANAAAAKSAGAADPAPGQAKGVENVFLEVAPNGVKPRDHTLSICDVALVVNIAKKSVVFDAENPGKLGPMKDGGNFEQFQIRQGAWTVPDKGSSRPILRPTELQKLETGILDRAGMAEFIADRGIDQVVVKSQGQIEFENDLDVPGWAAVDDVSGTFKMFAKDGSILWNQLLAQLPPPKTFDPNRNAVADALNTMPKTFTPEKKAVEETLNTIFGKP